MRTRKADLPEDPSCRAGLASLEVLAVPGEREHSVSVTQTDTHHTDELILYLSNLILSRSVKTIRSLRLLCVFPQTDCTLWLRDEKKGDPLPFPSQGDESSALSIRRCEAVRQETVETLEITGHFLRHSRPLCGFIRLALTRFLLIKKWRQGRGEEKHCIHGCCGYLSATCMAPDPHVNVPNSL